MSAGNNTIPVELIQSSGKKARSVIRENINSV